MTPDINSVIRAPQYDFLRTNPHLGENIMFLAYGGSHAYGTNIEGSDIDIRGCALASQSDILGLTNFEQVIDKETDTTIYSVPKLIPLLISCSPNVIEMLGGRPEYYTQVSPAGRLLLDHAHLFLSQKAVDTFGGYARQSLMRLKNAVARDRLSESEKEQHILEACNRTLRHMNERYTEIPEGGIRLFIDDSDKENIESEIFMDIDLKRYPLRDFVSVWRDLNDVSKNYKELNHRNHKKDDLHINKHMMHLVRLYLMLNDILQHERIVTYRENEHALLMAIRNGKFMDIDGKVIPEFYEMLNELTAKVENAAKHTNLPPKPDFNKINELAMEINRYSLATNNTQIGGQNV